MGYSVDYPKSEIRSYRLGCWLSWLIGRILFRLETHGMERIPAQGGFLLVSNHASYLDPPLVGCLVPRVVHNLAKSELFGVPVLGWMCRAVKAMPIRRGGVDREAMKLCVQILKSGKVVVLFPEGTRTQDGEMQTPRAGAAMIAVMAGVPCVPAYIDGTFRAWPRTRWYPWPAKVQAYYGEPFALPERPEGMNSKEHYQLCAEEMMRRIAALRPDRP
jgi:1-acyl-sn-glycerol-3-phosphate acyltransferase